MYGEPISVIGSGVVIDPRVLLEEIKYLKEKGVKPKLIISDRAHVIMPYHITTDSALSNHQGKLAAESTRRGIAPVYADKMFRNGIRTIDLLEPEVFKEKLSKGYGFSKGIIERALGGKLSISMDEIFNTYTAYGKQLEKYISDTSIELYNAHKKGKSILFEGAQGISLDVDHGIYPYTTSSNTVAGHISTGSGLGTNSVERIIGVVKSYLSRVGQGPLPSEIHENTAESLREKGKEYGTTTGRPRRVGWLDLVQIRQAVRVNGLTEIALTKLDILDGYSTIPVCVNYNIDGKIISEMPASLTKYRKAKPVYKNLPGWDKIDLDKIAIGYDGLPPQLKKYVDFIETQVECPIKIISVGPQRHETIIRS